MISWTMFCWEPLSPGIHVDVSLTSATYLNIIADQEYPFMAVVLTDGSGLVQQDNVPSHIAPIVRERFDERAEDFKMSPWPPNSDLNLWDVLVCNSILGRWSF